MTSPGFHVDTDALDAHAQAVAGLGTDIGSGAAAETAATQRADFGVLIGNTLGFGISALAGYCEQALRATGDAIAGTARTLRATSDGYCAAEESATSQVRSTEPGP